VRDPLALYVSHLLTVCLLLIVCSTVSQPNLKNTVKCVSLAIYYHIKNRRYERRMDIFDERLHPLTRDGVPDDYDRHNPEHRQIYKFVRTLFNAAQLTAECAIITLVYLERYVRARSTHA
jgi:hypothetical protein